MPVSARYNEGMKQKRNYHIEADLGRQIDLLAEATPLKKGAIVEEALRHGLPHVAKIFCREKNVRTCNARRKGRTK
jgi:predicted transcriptional regulator